MIGNYCNLMDCITQSLTIGVERWRSQKSTLSSNGFLSQFIAASIVLQQESARILFPFKTRSAPIVLSTTSIFSIVLGRLAHVSYPSILFALSSFVHICKEIKMEQNNEYNWNTKRKSVLVTTYLHFTKRRTMRTIFLGRAALM